MLFNPDPSKLGQEVLFPRKKKVHVQPTVSFNSIQLERASYQKHLGILLDEKLKKHINSAILKVNKEISVMEELRHSLPWKSLVTIYY